MKTYQGSYSWSFFDNDSGQTVTTEADHELPTEMVHIEKAVKFDLNKSINFHFEVNLIKYEIRIWDEQNLISTYNSFDDVKKILGDWNEGKAIAADIH